MFLKRSQLHNHVQALLLDLECFSFTVKPLKCNLIPKIKVQEVVAGPGTDIAKPSTDTVGKSIRTSFEGPCVTIHFDGGLNSIGVVGLDLQGTPVFAHGEFDE